MNLKFIQSSGIYTLANFINAAIPFLLLPLLTKYLTPTDFGIIAMIQVLISILLPLLGLNMDGVVSRYFFERDKIDFVKLISNALYIMAVSTLIVFIILFFYGKIFNQYLFGVEASKIGMIWLVAIVFLSFGQNLIQIQLNIWQVQQKPIHFGVLRIAKTVIEIGGAVFLIIVLKKSWEGRLEAQLFSVVFFALLSLYILYKENLLKISFDKSYIKMALYYGVPLVPHVLSGVIITFSDRIFITNMVSLKDTGLYSVGYQVGMVISLIQSSFNQAWIPWFFEKLKLNNEASKLKIVKFTYFYFLLMVIVVLLLTATAPLIFKFFIGKEFSSGIVFVFWIALGFGFNGMYKMVVNYIFYLNKTYIIAIITLCIAALNISLNYLLINLNGVIGAAQATSISFLLEFVIVWFVSAKLYKMPWLFFVKFKATKTI